MSTRYNLLVMWQEKYACVWYGSGIMTYTVVRCPTKRRRVQVGTKYGILDMGVRYSDDVVALIEWYIEANVLYSNRVEVPWYDTKGVVPSIGVGGAIYIPMCKIAKALNAGEMADKYSNALANMQVLGGRSWGILINVNIQGDFYKPISKGKYLLGEQSQSVGRKEKYIAWVGELFKKYGKTALEGAVRVC